jgi:multidrug transporter EmrE-like cation transporter
LAVEERHAGAALLFVLFAGCSSAGLLLFKYGWSQFAQGGAAGKWWSIPAILTALGAALYAASFLIWLVIVSRLPLTVAYPVAIGLSLVAITFGAVFWLGEPLSALRFAGATLILAGIALIVR